MLKKIFAHRGASAYVPENTLPAFEKAVDIGADGVELDIHLSRDGRLVVKPDSNGETAECILEFNYIYAEILDDPETDAVARTLKEQYELREKYDAELIGGFIRSLAELFADKEEYNSVDLEKIISGPVSA